MSVEFLCTHHTTLHLLLSRQGKLCYIRREGWWFAQEPLILYDFQHDTADVSKWIGHDFDSLRSWAGFDLAAGDYMSSFVHVTKKTEFTDPSFRAKVKDDTNLWTTTRFRIYSVPYWFLMLLTGIAPTHTALRFYFRWVRNETDSQNSR